jgi:hypothetical protein
VKANLTRGDLNLRAAAILCFLLAAGLLLYHC